MRRHCSLLCLLLVCLLGACCLPAYANINVGRFDAVHIVPAPGPVTLDGDLGDWDRSGEFFTYRYEEQKDKFALYGDMMYDADNLYIAAHISDSTPMFNVCDPDAEGSQPWNGDCLQVRISTDRMLGWPVKDPFTKSDRVAHISMWYYTPKAQPCLMMAYGMNYHELVVNPAGFKAAYKKDADGKGYVLEYAIPWKLLHADEAPPQPGDTLACIWQLIWGDDSGHHFGADLSEIRNPKDSSLAYQSAGGWGKAIYEKTGRLPKGTVVALDENKPQKPKTDFYPITYTIPGKADAHVSMHISDAQGRTVRWLLGDTPRHPGKNTELWNGLNNYGTPVPPGKYTVHWCYYNVKSKLLAAANNPGTPPYNSSDNKGSWAGDYGWPTGITANATHIFLADIAGEASRTMIKVTPQGQREWGTDPVSDIGPQTIDMCTDGADVYVLSGNFDGDPCTTGGYVKLSAETGYNEAIGDLHRSYVILTNPAANSGMGTTKNVSGIAVNADTVFVSSEQAGQIFCIDKQSGKQRSVIDKVDTPRGMSIGPDGRLYVVAGATVVSMKADGSERKTLVQNLMDPKRIAVAKNGEFYVSVRGFYQQVQRFAADGKLLNAIGKRGGMSAPGPWVKEAMRRPLGVAIAPDGNIWVTEETMNPKRTSVWKADGAFVTEYIGPVPYSSTVTMDPEDPEHVYSENTQFQIDYATGRAHPTAIISDDGVRGQSGAVNGDGTCRFIHFQGHTFISKPNGSIYELINNRAVLRVWFGMAKTAPREGWNGMTMGMGIDRNMDGKIDSAESQLCMVTGGCNWYAWVADNLDIYCGDSVGIWKLPCEGFDVNGVPNYDMAHCRLLLGKASNDHNPHPGVLPFPVPGGPMGWMVDSQGNLYVIMRSDTGNLKRDQSLLGYGHSLIKLSPDLKLLWQYKNVVQSADLAWNTTISKPGEIIGAMRFTGEFGRFVTISSYEGQYHVLDKETGLYITSITPDMRAEPPLDEMAVCAENFNGLALYAKKLKKYLYCGGDAGARIWEVQGLDEVKFATLPIIVSTQDAQQAVANSKIESGVAVTAKMLPARSIYANLDATLDKWKDSEWATFAVDEQRKGRAAMRWYSDGSLGVVFDVTDSSPLKNRGGNPSWIFKSGDCVEIDLSTAEPDAARSNEQPILGDKRLLVAIVQDGKGGEQPMTILYEPLSSRKDKTPGTFKSPVSTHVFEHVGSFPAQVAFKRRDGGYVLEVQFNAAQLGFTGLEMGKRLRADFGALFSDAGGSMVMAKTLWADDSPEVSIVNDVPTESKIRPLKWGWVVLR